MHQYCPGLGVGVEPQGAPDIKYLHYNEDKDKPASEQDKKEYKNIHRKDYNDSNKASIQFLRNSILDPVILFRPVS